MLWSWLFLLLTTSLSALHIYDLFNTPSLTTSRASISWLLIAYNLPSVFPKNIYIIMRLWKMNNSMIIGTFHTSKWHIFLHRKNKMAFTVPVFIYSCTRPRPAFLFILTTEISREQKSLQKACMLNIFTVILYIYRTTNSPPNSAICSNLRLLHLYICSSPPPAV